MRVVKGILAIIIGILAGSIVNGVILLLSFSVFGAPEGIHIFDAESFKANADKFSSLNFFGTWLAHQSGTLVGTFVAAKIAPARKMIFAIGVGVWFMLGGVFAATLVAAPIWYLVADIALYVPVAYIGGKIGSRRSNAPILVAA